MSARRDVIVVGAGHNGLTAAALLARAGRDVLLVERCAAVGGTALADEFHPGFRSAGIHHDARGVAAEVVADLQLARHGLVLRDHAPDVLGLDGGLVLRGDAREADREIRAHSARDADRLRELRAFLERVHPVVVRALLGPPLDLLAPDAGQTPELLRRAFALRRLGAATMMELLRLPPLPLSDFLGEWLESDALKTLLALPALAGGFAGPRSPGTTLNLLRLEAAAGPGPRGAGPALVAALERAARAHGVEVRTAAAVRAIRVDAGRVRGVVLDGGEEIDAEVVAAAGCAKHALLDLLPRGAISSRLTERMRGVRTRGTTAHVLLALDRPPSYAARPGETFELARTACRLDEIERAFDAVKYRRVSPEPVLELFQPAVGDPSLAPAGAAVLSVLVHFAPHDVHGGWGDAEREQLGQRVVELVERRTPDIRARIVGRAVRTPLDLERRYGLTGGQLHHGEHALDQLLVRPAPECSRYATPIAGLYLCGGGAHPGGGLTCRPGALAAAAILSGEGVARRSTA